MKKNKKNTKQTLEKWKKKLLVNQSCQIYLGKNDLGKQYKLLEKKTTAMQADENIYTYYEAQTE